VRSRQSRQQVVLLEDEGDRALAKPGPLRIRHLRQIPIIHADRAGRRRSYFSAEFPGPTSSGESNVMIPFRERVVCPADVNPGGIWGSSALVWMLKRYGVGLPSLKA